MWSSGGHRLAVLNALLGGKAMGVRELARRLGRDLRAVHNDMKKLVQAGIVEKAEDGKLSCEYREIVCEFAFRGLHRLRLLDYPLYLTTSPSACSRPGSC